jgi:hypothetical protein
MGYGNSGGTGSPSQRRGRRPADPIRPYVTGPASGAQETALADFIMYPLGFCGFLFEVVFTDFGRAPNAGNRLPDTGKRPRVPRFVANYIGAADALRRGGFEARPGACRGWNICHKESRRATRYEGLNSRARLVPLRVSSAITASSIYRSLLGSQ